MKCDICGRTAQFGHNVSHSKRRTNRRSEPNVHSAVLEINGHRVRLKVCTRDLRTIHKTGKIPA